MSALFLKALRLPLKRKILFSRVSLQMFAIRIGLRFFSLARIYKFLKRYQTFRFHGNNLPKAAEEICWAVNRAGRFWFRDEGCLAQALIGEILLIRLGLPARMRIGIRRDEPGILLAHAWVEVDGRIVIGGYSEMGARDFQSLPEIQGILENEGTR